ncbi:transglutaminase-like domain-containing protein [Stieleria varia]|uniref:Transglutaminase-like superfamily protein n=1 Tax=Stieleria varia TaxID=2528005 RepID=A0A5C6ALQ0_9BACT|nr:transglutaminase family protein [Stieleria varia]TWU00945.1 Transglutaminase-like superfamily protein [Stieleria varia]
MTQILVGSQLSYQVMQETTFLLHISASETSRQVIEHESLEFTPPLDVEICQVGQEGNRLHRIVVQPCELNITYQATVDLKPQVDQAINVGEMSASRMPGDVLPYLNPSRYCESDLLGRFAFEEFGQLDRGYSRVRAISDWVHRHLRYTSGSTNATTTAADVLLQRTGVCRDYAHLAIALCRGVGIPARYVAGYAVDLQPPDFHGFMEAFLDGRWYLFDPTKLAKTTQLIRIGTGRDAADVAFATISGNAVLTHKSVWANLFSDTTNSSGTDDGSAVSTA